MSDRISNSRKNFALVCLMMLAFCSTYASVKQYEIGNFFDSLPNPDHYPLNIDDSSKVYLIADIRPDFPGGSDHLFKYTMEHLHFPIEAMPFKINGIVVISFIVCKDGYLRDIKIVKGLGHGCDEEAIRFIASMNDLPQRWKPGTIGGKSVNVRYTLPIKFKWNLKK